MANPLNLQAVRPAEGIFPFEEQQLEQNQINQLFAELMQQQIRQREADVQHAARVIRYFDGELEMIVRELQEARQQLGQNDVDQGPLDARILDLMNRMIRMGNHREEQRGEINRLLDLQRVNGVILNEINQIVNEDQEAEREKLELIQQIRNELTSKIKEHDKSKKECVNASLKTHLAALLGMGVGGLTMAMTGSPFLLGIALKTNLVTTPFWGAAVYNKHQHDKTDKILDAFNQYIAEGVPPEIAEILAKK